MADLLTRGKIYRIETKAPAILGAVLERVRVSSILSYEDVLPYEVIDAKYASILPYLPPGTPPSARDATFYKLVSIDDPSKITIFCESWIEGTPVEMSTTQLRVMITVAAPSDISAVRAVLASLQPNIVQGFSITLAS